MPSEDQRRAAAIISFREELARLQAEGVLSLDAATLERLRARHDAELARLSARGDVDLTAGAARLSTGMRVATLLGTIALSAAYAFFVSAHWGQLALPMQLALVTVPTFVLLALTHVTARNEPSGYVASLLATVAVIAFFTNLTTLGALFNLPDSRMALLIVGGFAMLLAYGYGLTLPLLPGIAGIGGWLWTLGAIPLGLWWRDGFTLVEPMLLTGAVLLAVPAFIRAPKRFTPWWRGIGATVLVLGLLTVAESGQMSAITSLDAHTIELGYKVVGAVVLGGLVTWGIRRDERIVMQIGTAGAVLFLFMRLVDWFWDLVPKWLFFLLVGAFALGVLLLLRYLRRTRLEAA